MSDFAYTRCPGCRTVFRVTTAQLALREGQVRCGRCRAVFDANDHLVRHPGADETREPSEAQEPSEAAAPVDAPSEVVAQVDAAVKADTPAQSDALVQADAPPQTDAEAHTDGERSLPTETEATAQTEAPSETPLAASIAHPRDYQWRPRRRLREQPTALYALALVALVALLGAQLLFEYRDALAAHAPLTRPLLEAACRAAQCEIAPLRDASALSIEASDLQADPAHKGLLKLTATVRNRAGYAIAYPYLELTLTDPSDAVVARRAFPPAAYAPARAAGIAGNGEVVVTMFFDASATSQAGYRLYLFYP
jgi:predicted Zn finger-like uncharacterized protein